MAALDFPSSPTTGQIFVGGNGVSYQYNGVLWLASGASAGGDFCANHQSAFVTVTTTLTTMILTQVVSGNANGVYSTSTGRYTPPAGRYYISAGMSAVNTTASSTFHMYLRKNGTVIAVDGDTTPGINASSNPVASVTVDANGSDWFDAQTYTNTAGTNAFNQQFFLAFPISGIKGPPGDAGTALAQNAQTGNYTLVLGDANGHIYHAVAAATATYTIPANASVAYPLGTTLSFVNDSVNNVTIAITTDTLVLSPGTTTGSRTLATGGVATALKVTSTRWIINGTGLT